MDVTREIARRIAKPLVRTRVTPNHVTGLSFIVGVLGALSFLRGTAICNGLGGVLVIVAHQLDLVDGELARANGMTSEYGGWLDAVLDRLWEDLVILSVSYQTYVRTGTLPLLLTGMFLLIGIHFHSSMFAHYQRTSAFGKLKINVDEAHKPSVVLRTLINKLPRFLRACIPPRQFLLFSLLLFSLIDRLSIFLIVCCLGFCANNAFYFYLFTSKLTHGSLTKTSDRETC